MTSALPSSGSVLSVDSVEIQGITLTLNAMAAVLAEVALEADTFVSGATRSALHEVLVSWSRQRLLLCRSLTELADAVTQIGKGYTGVETANAGAFNLEQLTHPSGTALPWPQAQR